MGNEAIHIANSTSSTVRVIVAPNMDWMIADLVVGGALIVVDGVGVISTVSDIMKIWNAISFQLDAISQAFKVKKLFDEKGLKIEPGQVLKVSEHDLANPLQYLSPSAWAALSGGSDMTLTIYVDSDDPKQMKLAQFNSNSDWSWIIQDNKVVRAKYGTLWQADEGEGSYDLKSV